MTMTDDIRLNEIRLGIQEIYQFFKKVRCLTKLHKAYILKKRTGEYYLKFDGETHEQTS